MSLYTKLANCEAKKKLYEEDNQTLSAIKGDISTLKSEISSAMSGMRKGSKSKLKQGLGGEKGNSHQMMLNGSLVYLESAKSQADSLGSAISTQISSNSTKIVELENEIASLEAAIAREEEMARMERKEKRTRW